MSLLIDVKNLLFKYKSYTGEQEEPVWRTAIDDVSFSVKEGDFIGILGHNGSGKSTLAKQLAALLKPTGGTVYIKGKDTAADDEILSIRKTAGMVFQNPDNQLIGNVVEEDVAFGPENLGVAPDEIEKRIETALEATGMAAYRDASPNALSGGQKQRIAISGILAMEPQCIIFDEPTAMIDPEGRREVLNAIYALNREKKITIIYITHFMEEVAQADYLFVMNRGRLTLQGTPEELFKDTALLTENSLEPPFPVRLRALLNEKSDVTGLEIPETVCQEKELLSFLSDKIRKADGAGTKIGKKAAAYPENCSMQEPKMQAEAQGAAPEQTKKETQDISSEQKGIVLQNICYKYKKKWAGEDRYALRDVSLTIRPGEFVAVIGKTGSGKSTLIQHLNGLLEPETGSYYFDGEDIFKKDYNKKKLRQKVGLCFQYPEYQLFEETILKDIAFGPKNMGYDGKESEERARKAMELAGLSPELENQSPFSLSGGQKRRVALAGILAMEPEYLVLDEPAAGMDAPGRQKLFNLLHRLNKERGITVILVSHSMDDVAEHADRVLVMDEGCLVMDDSPEEVFFRTEELKKAGLDVPQALAFYLALQKEGTGEVVGEGAAGSAGSTGSIRSTGSAGQGTGSPSSLDKSSRDIPLTAEALAEKLIAELTERRPGKPAETSAGEKAGRQKKNREQTGGAR